MANGVRSPVYVSARGPHLPTRHAHTPDRPGVTRSRRVLPKTHPRAPGRHRSRECDRPSTPAPARGLPSRIDGPYFRDDPVLAEVMTVVCISTPVAEDDPP